MSQRTISIRKCASCNREHIDHRFLSFGAGVQTTALLLMDSYDEVIFADTGNELPETYEYIKKFILPYCDSRKLPFVTVRAKETLEEFCLRRKTIPSIKYRFSTRDFKIRPICRYLRKAGYKLPAVSVVGISVDEFQRMRTNHPEEFTYEYPLVEKRLTRKDCEQVIQNFGWSVPIKSGCWECPFNTKDRFEYIRANHPELWNRIIVLQENGKNYPRATILPKQARELHCDNGSCMV